jgi:hypothetical protein
MDGSSLPPPPIEPYRPDEATPEPGRSGIRGIWIGIGIGLLAVIVIATLVILTSDGDGLPESVDGLDRLHSSEAEAFEESLDEFALAGITISGAMYGEEEGPPLLLVERIEAGDGETAPIPLRATFDGAVVGFESSGAGEVDEGASVEGERSGFEVICASVEVVADPSMPGGVATMCGWRGRVIGVVFDFRTSDTTTALDTTGRIAQEVEAA